MLNKLGVNSVRELPEDIGELERTNEGKLEDSNRLFEEVLKAEGRVG